MKPSLDKNQAGTAMRVMLALASFIVIVSGLKAAQSLVIPILLAVFVAIVSFPLTKALMRIRFPRALAVLVTVFVDCGFLVGLAFLVNYLAGDLKKTILLKYHPLFMEKYGELAGWLRNHNLEGALDGVGESISAERVMSVSGQLFGAAATLLSVTVLVLILMTFFLSESNVYRRNLRRISSQNGPNFRKIIKASSDIQRYLLIKTLISFTTGLLAGLLCYACGLDFPLLWGIVAFALNFIPTIGSIVAAIPPVMLALITSSPGVAIIVALGYLLINMCLGNFLEPLFMGKQFGIATAVVLLSVLFWGWIWGPIGMLLAVPLTMIMKMALENSEMKWLATLISDAPKAPRRLKLPEPFSPDSRSSDSKLP